MNSFDAKQKNYVIVSDGNILWQALSDNTNYEFINSFSNKFKDKIDILIVDSESSIKPSILFRANIIINLTKKKISDYEITLLKPLFLKDLIKFISKNAADDSLFVAVNDEWIYNERANILQSQNMKISLTDKENDLFKAFLLSKNFSTDKESLRKSVWNHHRDTESTTIETHIYKLKQKLPVGMLEIKNSAYFLKL